MRLSASDDASCTRFGYSIVLQARCTSSFDSSMPYLWKDSSLANILSPLTKVSWTSTRVSAMNCFNAASSSSFAGFWTSFARISSYLSIVDSFSSRVVSRMYVSKAFRTSRALDANCCLISVQSTFKSENNSTSSESDSIDSAASWNFFTSDTQA